MNYFALTRKALIEPATKVLAPLGWASHGHWNQQNTEKIVQLADQGADPTEIDELITDHWNGENEVFLRHVAAPLRGYGKDIDHHFQRLQQQRANLMDQAIKCHQNAHYAAAILITLAQIDGLTRDVTGATFFSNATNDPYLDDSTLAGIASNLPVVRNLFREPVDSTGFHGKLSRHGAAHGRDLSFGTKVNSTKTLVLMGALIEYLKERAAKTARRERKKHEAEVQKKAGFSQSGRLNDDRHLDMLSFFQNDLDNRIQTHLRMPFPEPTTWEEYAHRLLEQRGLSRRRFTWGGSDAATYYWWFYQTPAGHFMGASGQGSKASFPSDWKQWLWDDSCPPSEAPWKHEGWAEYDGNYATPNWTSEPFV